MAFVPWPGFGPFESWDPEHTVAGGETLELAGLEFDVIFTPGHSPGHVTYAVRGEAALFSGDVLFEGSVGRIDLPGGDGPTLHALDRDAARRASTTTRSSTRATWASRRSARERATNPFLARARRPAVSEQPAGAARHVRRAARRTPRARARSSSAARRILERRRLPRASRRRPSRTPSCSRAASASRPTSSRRRCTPSTDGGGRSLTLRPEGTAPVCRAYVEHGMHKLPAAGEALVPVEPFFRYERRRPAATASSGRSAPRRSAPTTRRSTPSSIVLLTTLLDELGSRGLRLRLGSPRHARRRAPPTASELQAHLRAHEDELVRRRARAHRPQPAARLRLRPPGHARGHGRRAAAARPASTPTTPSTSPRSARCSTPPASPTRSTRRSCAAWTTTRARSSSSPPTRSAPRAASAAAGATTGSSSSSAARRRPAAAGRPGIERMLLAAGAAAGRRRRRSTSTSRSTAPAQRAAAFALAAEARRARPARADRARRPLAQGPAQAGRPARRPLRCDRGRRGDGA